MYCEVILYILDSESDENFSEAEESEDDEFTVKKVSKVQKKEKITTEKKIKSPAAAKKEKQTPKPSKSKPTAAAAGLYLSFLTNLCWVLNVYKKIVFFISQQLPSHQ